MVNGHSCVLTRQMAALVRRAFSDRYLRHNYLCQFLIMIGLMDLGVTLGQILLFSIN